MLHRPLKQKRHVGWRSLALGVGIGVGLSELARQLVARLGWRVPWWHEDEYAFDNPPPARTTWTPPLEPRSADVSMPSNVAPFRSPQVPTHVDTPLPELPEDVGSEAPVHADTTVAAHREPGLPDQRQISRTGAAETLHSSTPEEVRQMDSESIHNEQARQEVPSDDSLPKDIRTAVAGDEDMRRIAIETLRENPQASLDEVMSAWHVHRGVTIDAEEAAKVASVYGRLNETYEVA